MEQTPKKILAALEKSGIGGFRFGNLKQVAKLLTEDCALAGTSIETVAEKLLVSTRTAKDYISVFRHAKAYLGGDQSVRMISKAKARVFPYLGVFALLSEPKPVRVVKTFKDVKHLQLPAPPPPKQKVEVRLRKRAVVEDKPQLPPPPTLEPKSIAIGVLENRITSLQEELDVKHGLTEELQGRLQSLNVQHEAVKDVVQRMLRIEHMTDGICSAQLKTHQQVLTSAARYFDNLVSILGTKSPINMAEGLKAISASLDETVFPSHTIWQGKAWTKILRTFEFNAEYRQLTPRQRDEIKKALFHLSLNWRHPSLRSHKMEVNPRGVPTSALYSWASDKLRFYWSIEHPSGSDRDSTLTLHRLETKRG